MSDFFYFLFVYFLFCVYIGIPQLGKLSNINTTSNDANSKASSINGNTSAATIAAMANAMVAAAQANANAAAANAGIVAIQQQNQKAAAAAALVSAASSTTGSGIVNTLPGEPDPNDPNSSSQKKTCPYCCQQLSWHALSRHIRDMHRARTGLVTCKYCHKMFRNKNSLGCHMWRFHKDMREKDQAGSSNSSSGIKGEIVNETNSHAVTTEVVDPLPLSEFKSSNSLSAASLPSGSGSKASSPTSKSEIVLDPPAFGEATPSEVSNTNNKDLDQEQSMVDE